MDHIVLFRVTSPDPLSRRPNDAAIVLRAMRDVLAMSTPDEWSGPDDGSMAGHLDCVELVDAGVHHLAGGLHLDVTILHDPDDPDRGGQVGTVVDERIGISRFMGLDAGGAHAEMLRILDGLIAEVMVARTFTGPDAPQALHDARVSAQDLFAAASASTGLVDPKFMVSVCHPTPHGDADVTGTDGPDREWRLDDDTSKAVAALLPPCTVYALEARENPAVIRVKALSWMPDWRGPTDPVGIMRTLSERGIAHRVGLVEVPSDPSR